MNEQERTNFTKNVSNMFTDILNKYIDKANQIEDWLELEDITTDMIEELREKCMPCLIDGEKYEVIEIAKHLKKYDKDCKDVILDSDRLSWVVREFHNSYYNYDEFEDGVKKAMFYMQEYYEESKY